MGTQTNPRVVDQMRTIPYRAVQTQQIEALLRKAEVGQIVTYEEMGKLISGDVRGRDNGFVQSAKRVLSREGIIFETIKTVGLKRASDAGKVDVVTAGRKRIHSAARRGLRVAASVERSNLNQEQAQRFDMETAALGVVHNLSGESGIKRLTARPQQGQIPGEITVPKI